MLKKSQAVMAISAALTIIALDSAAATPVPVDQTDVLIQIAKHGRDDRQRDDRGGRRYTVDQPDQIAKHGRDDRQRDDRGGRRYTVDQPDQLAKRGRTRDDHPKPEGEDDLNDDHGSA